MRQFKVGDKVTLIRANHYKYPKTTKQLFGKLLVVISVNSDGLVLAGVPGEGGLAWHADDLRAATTEEIEAAKKARPLRRGDLVVYNNDICVVFSNCADRDGDYAIASLTGDPDHYCVKIDELVRIGSVGKKVRLLKNEMEGAV